MKSSAPIYAIGDIHGSKHLLCNLLAQIKADASEHGVRRPRVIVLGDMIDRGLDSRGVIDLFLSQEFRDDFESTELMGNHEWAFNNSLLGDQELAMEWLHHGGAETVESYGIEFGRDSVPRVLKRFLAAIPKQHLDYLSSLPVMLRERDMFFVHAGVNPNKPLDQQEIGDMICIGKPFLTHTGDFGARVVHGHTITRSREVEAFPNRIAVDTGAGFKGGKLSSAVIMPSGDVRFLSALEGKT